MGHDWERVEDKYDKTRPKMKQNKNLNGGLVEATRRQRRPEQQECRKMSDAQIACTTEEMVAKDILALVPESLDDLLECAYKDAHTEVCSVVYSAVEHVQWDLLHQNMIGETLDVAVATCITSGNAADKVWGRILSTNSFMTQIPVVNQRQTDESIVV